jgi:hypothetical protein
MNPVGHALSPFVPIYGLFRIHAHYEAIRDLLRPTRPYLTVWPTPALLGWILGSVLSRVSNHLGPTGLALALSLAGSASVAVAVMHGQDRLNVYWTRQGGGSVPARVRWTEWLLLAVAVGISFLMAIALWR